MMRRFVLTAAVVVLALAGRCEASPVTYLVTGVGTGTLGGSAFTDAQFLMVATADTDDVVSLSGGDAFAVDNQSALIIVGGMTAAFLDPSLTVVVPLAFIAGVATGTTGAPGFALAAVENADLEFHDLTTSIGPLDGPLRMADPPPSINTTLGVLSFSSLEDGVFLAAVETAAVPEPPTLALAGLGGLGLLRMARRRRRA
jgi:hypothetical protein